MCDNCERIAEKIIEQEILEEVYQLQSKICELEDLLSYLDGGTRAYVVRDMFEKYLDREEK